MEDICNFIPSKPNKSSIEYFHFVYETGYKKLRQPFIYWNYYVYLVFKGCGKLKINGKEYDIEKGSLFFTFPEQSYEIKGDDNLTYLYISFNGQGVRELLSEFCIDGNNFHFRGFEHLFEFWMDSIRRINKVNATALTESVFMYTLSFINNTDTKTSDKFESILEYIDSNCSDCNISLKKVADIFFYSEKYLSSLFAKKMNIRFTEYLNEKRIKKAMRLIEGNDKIISEIAAKCGFSDPFYFSKVFKKITGITPTAYIKEKSNES